jgi:hypothetical protein
MKIQALVGTTLLALSLAAFGVGCGAADEASTEEAEMTEDALGRDDDLKQLGALTERVRADFAGAPTLADATIEIRVTRHALNRSKAFIQGRIVKVLGDGDDWKLARADYVGSVFEERAEEGLFDDLERPVVSAILEKRDGAWVIAKRDDVEAYAVSPTDLAYSEWDLEYDVPRSWLGLRRRK